MKWRFREFSFAGELHHTLMQLASAALVIAVLATAWLAYAPGLAGSFVFDDFGALPALSDYGRVDNWDAFLYYVTSGTADPAGRPLTMLSFLIDANAWPADPESFKRTNILLHLLNGVLLCWLLCQLGRLKEMPARRAEMAALLGAAFWLLHPLWTSTTLYVVQRAAILAGTFVLLGLLAFVHGRRKIATHPLSGVFWIAGVVGLCTILGVLSKANALLLPLLVTVVESIFIRSADKAQKPSRVLAWCLIIAIYPIALATIAYLAYCGFDGITHGIPSYRSWTLAERLLTEPRALLDYLYLLVAPHPYSRGLFVDNYPAAQDLLHPWSTLPSLLIVIAMAAAAVVWRKRYPAVALAIAFFLAGHVMESSTLALELYFEHRNYVPAMLLFWPFAIWISNESSSLLRLKYVLALVTICLLGAETHAAAELWGEPKIQALVWAEQNPGSPRAQVYAASAERAAGRLAQAEVRLREAMKARPDEIQLTVNLLGVACQRGMLSEADVASAERALRTGAMRGPLALDWLVEGIDMVRNRGCAGLSLDTIQRLIDAARQNVGAKDLPRFQQNMDNIEGQIALALGENAKAEQKFLEAIAIDPLPAVALNQAALLGTHNLPRAALMQLDYYEASATQQAQPPIRNMEGVHRWLLLKNGYWRTEMSHLREVLSEDVKRQSGIMPP